MDTPQVKHQAWETYAPHPPCTISRQNAVVLKSFATTIAESVPDINQNERRNTAHGCRFERKQCYYDRGDKKRVYIVFCIWQVRSAVPVANVYRGGSPGVPEDDLAVLIQGSSSSLSRRKHNAKDRRTVSLKAKERRTQLSPQIPRQNLPD